MGEGVRAWDRDVAENSKCGCLCQGRLPGGAEHGVAATEEVTSRLRPVLGAFANTGEPQFLLQKASSAQ